MSDLFHSVPTPAARSDPVPRNTRSLGNAHLERGLVEVAGLTVYQAKTYVTLVMLRTAKVQPLARESGVPRNKLYNVLGDLEHLGLVERFRNRPREYRPLSISAHLDARIRHLADLREALTP